MECKNCGAALSEEAKFCSACGARTDGTRICPSCGKSAPAEALFCPHCESRMDGKTACIACGAVFEGEICPACGWEKNAVPAALAPEPAAVKKDWKKPFDLAGSAAFLAGLLILLVCCFFVGTSVTVKIETEIENLSTTFTVNLTNSAFDYLITSFKTFAEETALLKESGTPLTSAYYVGSYSVMVADAIVVGANLLIILTAFVLATIKFALNFGRREIAIGKFFCLAACSFFFTVIYLNASVEINGLILAVQEEGISFRAGMNQTCIVGLITLLIVGAVGLAGYIAANAEKIRKSSWTLIFVSAIVLFLGIAAILLSGAALRDETGAKAGIRYLLYNIYTLSGMTPSLPEEIPVELLALPSVLASELVASFWFQTIALIMCAATAMTLTYRAAAGRKPRILAGGMTALTLLIGGVYVMLLFFLNSHLNELIEQFNELIEQVAGQFNDVPTLLTGSVAAEAITGAVHLFIALCEAIVYMAVRGHAEEEEELPSAPPDQLIS